MANNAQPKQTLEQKRAQDAWRCCERYEDKHIKLAKGLPALIMNSGLLQTLAFCQQKGDAHEIVASHLRSWLAKRFPEFQPEFKPLVERLMDSSPADYQAITAEAFAWLKWLRQMAAARGPAADRAAGA